jgi:hypothetical protein
VQERLELRGCIEVAGLAPEREVGDEARARRDVLAQAAEFVGQEHEPAERQAGEQHDDERRKEPAHAPPVEVGEAEAPALQVLEDDARDEKARDDEEDIHAGEAAGRGVRERVKGEHGEHRDRAQAVDIGPVRRAARAHRASARRARLRTARRRAGDA